ncbi:DUF6879 family protein [Cryptosporangium sp. NPDC048952]|uniref:DUF6879 family protein n=1 Tax=Cryptosporangium sp. NPDC048952 TaxID=3363961 RepID=UPI003712D486
MTDIIDFAALFAGCREAFWLEGNPVYDDPAEQKALAHHQATGKIVPPDHDWPRIDADATAAGTRLRRLRLVSEPLTGYEAWEPGVFASGWAGDEQIRVLPRFPAALPA